MGSTTGLKAFIICFLSFLAAVSSRACSNTPFYVDCEDGDVILAGLFNIHERTADDRCGTALNVQQLANAEAMVYAINQVNYNPYLLPNITLGYRIFDTCGIPARASSIAFSFVIDNALVKHARMLNATQEELINDVLSRNISKRTIAAVIGPADSESSTVVASALQVGNIPQISPSSTSEELTQSQYRTFFRTVPHDRQQAKAISDIIEYFNWTYISIIAIDTSYGRFGARAMEHEVHDRDTYCIHSIDYFPPLDYESKIQRIVSELKRAENVKVIVLWASDTTSINYLLHECLKLQMFDRTWIAPDGWSEKTSLFASQYLKVIGGFLGTTFRQFNVSSFDQHLLATNSSSLRINNSIWWQEFWQAANNCSQLAWKGCSKYVRSMNKDLLSVMKSTNSAFVIDAVQAAAHAIDLVYRCHHDQTNSSQLNCSGIKSNIYPKEVLHALRMINFQGVTGSIRFNENGDSSRSAAYDIVNLQLAPEKTPSLIKVGTWDRALKRRLQVKKDRILWKNGSIEVPPSRCSDFCPPGTRQTSPIACCWECIPCALGTVSTSYGSKNCSSCQANETSSHDNTKCETLPFDNLTWGDLRGIILAVIASIGVILTLFTLGVFVKYRDTPVVKSSNRELSYAFLMSILAALFSASVLINGPTLFSCTTNLLFNTITFNFCVSILFLKTSRLVHVFDFQAVLTVKYRWFYNRRYQFVALGILNLFPLVIFAVFLVMKPPSIEVTIVPFQYMILQCRSITTAEIIVSCTLYAYELILSVMLAYYAFRARKLPSNFNETKYIAFNMYIQFIIWGTTLAIFTSLSAGSFRTVLYCLMQLCNAYSFLLCIFAPKLFIIFLHPEKNTLDFVKAAVSRNTMERNLSNSLVELSVVPSAGQSNKPRANTSPTTLSFAISSPVVADNEIKMASKDHALRRGTRDSLPLTGSDFSAAFNIQKMANGVGDSVSHVKGSSSIVDESKELYNELRTEHDADMVFSNPVVISVDSLENVVSKGGAAKDISNICAQDTRL